MGVSLVLYGLVLVNPAQDFTERLMWPSLADHERRAILRDGEIEAIGPAGSVEIPEGAEVIDYGDRWLAPGFIDSHSHADSGLFDRPGVCPALSQEITIAVVGQDGSPLAMIIALHASLVDMDGPR